MELKACICGETVNITSRVLGKHFSWTFGTIECDSCGEVEVFKVRWMREQDFNEAAAKAWNRHSPENMVSVPVEVLSGEPEKLLDWVENWQIAHVKDDPAASGEG